MADYKVTDTEMVSVANAIRTKGGTSAQLEWPSGFISAINAIPTPSPGPDIVPWSTGTDSQIIALIQAAHNGDIDLQQDAGWAVGDVRSIDISAFTGGGNTSHAAQNIDIVISSFDDYNNCGCVMQFDFKETLTTYGEMNRSATNVGGYGSSEMKTTTLPALVNALPAWLKDILIEFSVLVSAGGQSSTIETVTGNKLALRSEIEVFGTASQSKAGEGSQIPYYRTASNIIKNINGGSVGNWWERSPYGNSEKAFCFVASSGGSDYDFAGTFHGIAPFGCL